MAVDGKYAGHILISDVVETYMQKRQLQNLKKCGIKKTVMLTGDTDRV